MQRFGCHGGTASWWHDSGNDLAIVYEVFDVWQRRESEVGFAVLFCGDVLWQELLDAVDRILTL
jgi:hypothetical protein